LSRISSFFHDHGPCPLVVAHDERAPPCWSVPRQNVTKRTVRIVRSVPPSVASTGTTPSARSQTLPARRSEARIGDESVQDLGVFLRGASLGGRSDSALPPSPSSPGPLLRLVERDRPACTRPEKTRRCRLFPAIPLTVILSFSPPEIPRRAFGSLPRRRQPGFVPSDRREPSRAARRSQRSNVRPMAASLFPQT